MELKQARRKSFDVEYVKVTEDNIAEVALWCGGVVGGEGKDRFVRLVDKNAVNTAQTKAFFGDLVLGSPTGYKKYTQKSFDKSFDAAQNDNRSAVTGQFVSDETAEESPDTTVHETRGPSTDQVDLPADADPS